MVMTCVFALQNPAAAQADAGSGQATPAQGLRPLSELRGTLEEFGLSYQLGLTGLIQSASETAADRDTLASYSFDFLGAWTLIDNGDTAGGLGWLVEGGRPLGSDRDSDLSADVGVGQGLNDDLDSTDVALTELWWSQSFADQTLVVSFGRLDQTVYFDANAVANDETSGFLATPLVNSVGVAFPENGLGVNVTWTPTSGTHYVSAGLANANADGGESTFDDLGGGDLFAAVELGWTPTFQGELAGNYRLLGWSSRAQGGPDGQGISLSADQQVGHGVTAFGRYSVGDQNVLDFDRAASGGLGLTGFNGRDDDLLGVAVGWARAAGGAGEETLGELFYRYTVNDAVSVTPHLQWVDSLAGDEAVIVGLRIQATY